METIIFILSIITLIIIGVVGVTITNRNIRDTYIAALKIQLPDVARNVIENILSNEPDSITIEDIINFGNDYIPSDIYLSGIELIKDKLLEYINEYIDKCVTEKTIKIMLKKSIANIDSELILDAIDKIMLSEEKDENGETLYSRFVKLLHNYVSGKLNQIDKEEKEAEIIAEQYENETVENVPEYNGELDKSEFDIARENFQPVGAEYPEEENLDEIPEELVEIIAMYEDAENNI